MSAEVGTNKYEEVKTAPVIDLVFTSTKRSLIDRVSDAPLQFTRNTIGTYVDENGIIQTAAAGEPRYTYDPVTGEDLGLLVEESRTNLHLQSQDFSTWIGDGTTPTSNSGLAPDGTNTANLIQEKAETNSHYLQKPDASVTSGTTYTFSVFLKKGSGATAPDWIVLAFSGNGFPANAAVFNIATGELGNTSVAVSQVISSGISEFPGGWYRCHVTVTADETRNSSGIIGFNNNQNTAGLLSYAGQTTSDVYAWGAQLEAGSFPTSYIPTSGSTVTRDPDTVTLTNNNLYNNSEFDIINQPFGVAAGSNTLQLLPSDKPIKRVSVFSPNLTQTRVNQFAEKEDEFWRWRVKGDSFGLPTYVQSDGNMTIDWGDGTVEEYSSTFLAGSNSISHTFVDGKEYHDVGFRLDSGTYFRPRLYQDGNNRPKLIAIGPAPENMKVDLDAAFRDCANLESIDSTFIAGGGANNASSAFRSCTKLKSFPKIDTSNIGNFSQAWFGCSGLTSFPLIDTSSGTNFIFAWQDCTSLTEFPLIDTSSGTRFYASFRNLDGLTSFPLIDTSSSTDFGLAWQSCSNLTSFPLIDTSNGITFGNCWDGCNSLTSFPLLDTSSATDFLYAWRGCSSLTSFPQLNTSNVTRFYASWFSCSSLTEFPSIDTSSGTNFESAWYNCSSLTEFPSIDISNSIIFRAAWRGCSSLTSFPANFFDSWTGTPSNNCFVNTWDNCSSLTATSVENILTSISVSAASGTPPASGTDITIDYDAASGTPDITVGTVDLIAKGWVPTLNGSAKTDPYSSDFATLDLDFATNLSLTDNISGNNLITFSRNSIGTYVDSNGVIQTAAIDTPRFDHDPDTLDSLGLLVEESRTNKLINSSTFSSGYTLSADAALDPNYAISPDGTIAASLLRPIADTTIAGLERSIGAVTSAEYIVSVFAKASGKSWLILFNAQANYRVWFNLSTGTVGTVQGQNTPPYFTTGSIEPYGDGWYRCSVKSTVTFNYFAAYVVDGDNSSNVTVNGNDGILIWGAQLEAGSFPTSYIPTLPTFTSRNSTATYYDANGIIQTAGVNVARDDAYLPDENGTFYPAGLLVEAAATNLVDSSTNYTSSGWWDTQTNVTSTPNSSSSPDGSNTSSLFTCSSGGGTGSVFVRRTGYLFTAGQPYTLSTFAKASTSSIIWVGIYSYNGPNRFIYFDLSNGTSSVTDGVNIQNLANGWYRCSVTATSATTGGANIGIGVCNAFNSLDCTLDGSKSVFLWGAQLETSPYPTSYIPTAGSTVTRASDVTSSSTVTRAADVAQITGTNFSSWYNQSEGSILCKYKCDSALIASNYPRIYAFNAIPGGSNTASVAAFNPTGAMFINFVADSSSLLRIDGALSSAVLGITGVAYKTNNSVGFINGVSSTDGSSPHPTNTDMVSLDIGGDIDFPTRILNGHISRLTYWPKRLTDTSLQYLTQ